MTIQNINPFVAISELGDFLSQQDVNNFKNPINYVQAFSQKYPKIFPRLQSAYLPEIKEQFKWPDYCYLPSFVSDLLIHVLSDEDQKERTHCNSVLLAALSSWYFTRGIYQFEPLLFEELSSTKHSGDIPVDALMRLPQSCVYLEIPSLCGVYGFFAYIDYSLKESKPSLILLINTFTGIVPIGIELGRFTLQQGLTNYFTNIAETNAIALLGKNQDFSSEHFFPVVQVCVSLLLYLCSSEPDIDSINGQLPTRPAPKKTKKGFKLFPPSKPNYWQVGNNTSKQIYQAKDYQGGSHKNPKAHIRKAHWHGVRTGKRGSAEERLEYRWWPPTVVNCKSSPSLH